MQDLLRDPLPHQVIGVGAGVKAIGGHHFRRQRQVKGHVVHAQIMGLPVQGAIITQRSGLGSSGNFSIGGMPVAMMRVTPHSLRRCP